MLYLADVWKKRPFFLLTLDSSPALLRRLPTKFALSACVFQDSD
jgi:hypothetical protein